MEDREVAGAEGVLPFLHLLEMFGSDCEESLKKTQGREVFYCHTIFRDMYSTPLNNSKKTAVGQSVHTLLDLYNKNSFKHAKFPTRALSLLSAKGGLAMAVRCANPV